MRTNEFKRKLESMDYKVFIDNESGLIVVSNSDDLVVATTNKYRMDDLVFHTGDLKLVTICLEYVNTQIIDRDGLSLYVVVLPDPERRMSKVMLMRADDGRVVIGMYDHDEEYRDEVKLTWEEVVRNHRYLVDYAELVD